MNLHPDARASLPMQRKTKVHYPFLTSRMISQAVTQLFSKRPDDIYKFQYVSDKTIPYINYMNSC